MANQVRRLDRAPGDETLGPGAKLFAEQFRAALLEAGISDYVRPFHDLRHTALTNEAAAGSSPIALMAKAGHSDMKTTRIYLHLGGTVFPEEAEALERRLLGAGSPGRVREDELLARTAQRSG